MQKWEKVPAEMWAEVDPDAIRFTTLFDEIVFVNGQIAYRAHTPDHSGPLRQLFLEMCQRFSHLPFAAPEASS